MAFATSQASVLNPWLQILSALEKKVIRQSFETWLKPTRYSHATGRTLYVRVPSPEFQHIGDKYGDLIQEAIDLQSLEFDDVSFVTAEEDPSIPPQRKDGGFGPVPAHAPTAPPPSPARSPEQGRFDWSTAAQLNSRYTFDNFVIGNGNQFARAASLAVAERPSRAYNPLFLYGGVGMGKTHLMHAIGHHIKERDGEARIAYVHSERFVGDMVRALQHNTMNEFKAAFRSLDALLIDDIQFFAGKERSQEEFFHTFNELLEGQHQVILTCDRYPKEVSGLEERLKSRFGWGLTVAIEPPELETCVAILMTKAHAVGVALPEEVAFFVAKRIRSNIRELEGALRRVIANSRFTGQPITLDFAKEALRDLLQLQAKLVTIENIQRT